MLKKFVAVYTYLWFPFYAYLNPQILRLFTVGKAARKWKVFEWEAYVILICTRAILQKVLAFTVQGCK